MLDHDRTPCGTYLWCALCERWRERDSFSAAVRRGQYGEGMERPHCLWHTQRRSSEGNAFREREIRPGWEPPEWGSGAEYRGRRGLWNRGDSDSQPRS